MPKKFTQAAIAAFFVAFAMFALPRAADAGDVVPVHAYCLSENPDVHAWGTPWGNMLWSA